MSANNIKQVGSEFAKMLDKLTRDEVNAALKKYLNYTNVKVVFITPGAQELKSTLVNNTPSPITYASEKPDEIYEEDKQISTYPLTIESEAVKIVKLEDVFEK